MFLPLNRLRFMALLMLSAILSGATFSNASVAQNLITPDNTLGANSSSISPTEIRGLPAELIEGGVVQGQNLFHSFSEFNIGAEQRIYFFSPIEAKNIFSRITGDNTSNINGVLGTFGPSQATLFFMNPNGVLFGGNASLDMQGSFFATTADSIRLGDTGMFSALSPQLDQLLSVDPSAFLFSETGMAGRIIAQSQRERINPISSELDTTGLQVPNGETLSLSGRQVVVDSGFVIAPGGQIEIASVLDSGTIGLTEDARLQLPNQVARGDQGYFILGNVGKHKGSR